MKVYIPIVDNQVKTVCFTEEKAQKQLAGETGTVIEAELEGNVLKEIVDAWSKTQEILAHEAKLLREERYKTQNPQKRAELLAEERGISRASQLINEETHRLRVKFEGRDYVYKGRK